MIDRPTETAGATELESERRPLVERMEPRALLSGMEPAGAAIVPPHHAGTELAIPINERSPFHVMYRTTVEDTLRSPANPALVEAVGKAQQGTPQTPTMAAADETTDDPDDDDDDDTDSDDGGDDDDDGDDGGDTDNGDEIDDENND